MVNALPFGDEIMKTFFLALSLKAMEMEKNLSGCMCVPSFTLGF